MASIHIKGDTLDMDNQNLFVINDGILLEYHGTDREIAIPKDVHTIACDAFKDNMNLVSVDITEGVKCVDVGAFTRCRNIAEIYLPDSLMEIGMGAFAFCTSLQSIKIPRNVKKIGCSAFLDCSSLNVVDYHAQRCRDIISDGNYDFYTYSDYGNFYDDIYPVFSGCTSLKTVHIGENVKYIPSELFGSAYSLEEVNIHTSGKLNIGFKAFSEQSDLRKIIHVHTDSDIVFQSLTNRYRFPALHVNEGALVKHISFGLGEVQKVYSDRGLIQVRFFQYDGNAGMKSFLYPDSFYLGKLRVSE